MKTYLKDTHPNLYEELVEKKEEITTSSAKSVLWLCPQKHQYSAVIHNRSKKGSNCPFCSGRYPIPGETDLTTLRPELAKELVNKEDAKDLTIKSNKKVLWICSLGHEWMSSVNNRSAGKGCPYCSGQKVLSGFNDLATKFPEIAFELVGSDPSTVHHGSNKKYTFRCANQHEWVTALTNRTRSGTNCPYCSNQKILTGFNDLNTTHPQLATELVGTDPTTIQAGSNNVFRWSCSEGHEWEATAISRKSGKGCPYCTNQKVLVGFNDLQTTHPQLAREIQIPNPTTVTAGSGEYAEWMCPKGHVWGTRIVERSGKTRKATGCPTCVFSNNQSSTEKELAESIRKFYQGVILIGDRKTISGLELDILLPDLNIAIEFNGVYYHSEKFRSRDYHKNKLELCQKAGIRLIQIWEDDYLRDPELVLRVLSHKLGVSSQERVPARKTYVSEISYHEARDFLEENHLQGHARGSYYLGLKSKVHNELVSVMVLKRTKDTLTLERYATSRIVSGGQSKLLSYVDKNIPYEKVYTFADLEVSTGDLYEKSGWSKDKVLLPDYKYLYQNKRVHKFNFRKDRFRANPNLKYDPTMTETQLAQLNGLLRVWDSGKIRYVRTPN